MAKANPVAGYCICPVCTDNGAEVRTGINGTHYIVCDSCCSMIRTMSRRGREAITSRMRASSPTEPAHEPAPAPKAETKPAPAAAPVPKPQPKAKSSWLIPAKL